MAMFSTVHTARKAHECFNCGGQIRPGERYELLTAPPRDPELNNDNWWRSRAHLACYGEDPNRE